MLNKKLLRVLLVLSLLTITSAWAAPCTLNSAGAVTDSVSCTVEATSYVVKVYKVGVCSAPPVAPTTAGDPADLSKCSTVFENAAGTTISVRKGVSTELSDGTFTAPAVGTYSHAYAVLGSDIQVQGSTTFQNSQTVVTSDGTPVVGKGAGVKCWTLTSTFRASSPAFSGTVDCGNNLGTVGTVTDITDALYDDVPNAPMISCVSGTDGSGCVTDSTLKQATGTSVTRLLMLYSNLALSYSSGKHLDLAFVVSSGVSVQKNGADGLQGFQAGPLNISLSMK